MRQELNRRRPLVIGFEYECQIGQNVRATHFLNARLPKPLLFRIVRQATREEYVEAVGAEPSCSYFYEVQGENGGSSR